MGKLVYVRLGIEETAFIPVMRVLKTLPGCADLEWNMDSLDAPRGGKRGPREMNGHAGPRVGAINIIIKKLLDDGPQPRAILNELLVAAGYVQHSVDGRLNGLKNKGVIESFDGIWGLTKDAEANLRAAAAPQEPAKALPPPTKQKRATPFRGKFKAPDIVLAAMRMPGAGGYTAEMTGALLDEQGFKPSGAWPVLQKLKVAGLVKTVTSNGKKFFELTAAGKKAKLPAELLKE